MGDKATKNYAPSKAFKSQLISALSRDLPSVGVASNYTGLFDPITLLSDYVGRELALVLIDCRTLAAVPFDSLVSPNKRKGLIVRQKSLSSPPITAEFVGGGTDEALQRDFYAWAKQHIEQIDRDLGDHSWNFYQIATISFLHSVLQQYEKGETDTQMFLVNEGSPVSLYFV